MVGRGVIARPSLGREICAETPASGAAFEWPDILELIGIYQGKIREMQAPPREAGRLKQWIKLLGRTYPAANDLFLAIRRLETTEAIMAEVARTGRELRTAA